MLGQQTIDLKCGLIHRWLHNACMQRMGGREDREGQRKEERERERERESEHYMNTQHCAITLLSNELQCVHYPANILASNAL